MHANITRLPPRLPIRQIAAAVEALIALLDEAAGDADFEDAVSIDDEDDDPAEDNGDLEAIDEREPEDGQ